MKQYKTTIISLAVIAVVLIAFFVVSSILDKDEAEAPVPTASQEVETERVFGFASVGDIVTYECSLRSSSLLLCPLRIFRKPPLSDTLLLLLQLTDTPQAGKSHHSESCRANSVIYKNRNSTKNDSSHQEYGPYLRTKIILTLYYNWMKNSDSHKTYYTNNHSGPIHLYSPDSSNIL